MACGHGFLRAPRSRSCRYGSRRCGLALGAVTPPTLATSPRFFSPLSVATEQAKDARVPADGRFAFRLSDVPRKARPAPSGRSLAPEGGAGMQDMARRIVATAHVLVGSPGFQVTQQRWAAQYAALRTNGREGCTYCDPVADLVSSRRLISNGGGPSHPGPPPFEDSEV